MHSTNDGGFGGKMISLGGKTPEEVDLLDLSAQVTAGGGEEEEKMINVLRGVEVPEPSELY